MKPFITVDLTEQTPAARGRQHGVALKSEITSLYERYLRIALSTELGSEGERELLNSATRYWPQMSEWAPELAEELVGIADGAGLDMEKVLLLNLFDEFGDSPRCTGFAVGSASSTSGNAVVGQNIDLCSWFLPFVVFRYAPTATEVGKVMLILPGVVGGPGINSSIGITWLTTHPTDTRVGIPGTFIVRRALEETDVEKAMEVATSARRAMGSHLAFTDGKRAFLYQGTAEHHVVEEIVDVGGHANNYLDAKLLDFEHLSESDPKIYATSCHRGARMSRLVQDAVAHGTLDREQLGRMLADHDGFPYSVCQHAVNSNIHDTLGALILEPAQKRLWFTPGTPCNTPFESVEVPLSPDREPQPVTQG